MNRKVICTSNRQVYLEITENEVELCDNIIEFCEDKYAPAMEVFYRTARIAPDINDDGDDRNFCKYCPDVNCLTIVLENGISLSKLSQFANLNNVSIWPGDGFIEINIYYKN